MRDLADAGAPTVTRLAPCGMLTVRADLAAPWLADAIARAGLALPPMLQIAGGTAGQVAWMSPDELLILCAPDRLEEITAALTDGLAGHHHLLADVSDARARFALEGPRAEIALAKLCPVDVRPLAPGEIRRTRLAQVPAALWRTEPDGFALICFRSVSGYAQDALEMAARDTADLALP